MLPVLAALAAGASLLGKFQKDDNDRAREQRAEEMFKQQQASQILSDRARAGGVDTQSSDAARAHTAFDAQQFANRRDTSGDWVPFVQSLGGLAQGVVGEVGNAKPDGLSAALDKSGLAGQTVVNGVVQSAPGTSSTPADDRDAYEYLRRLSGGR